MNLLVGVTGQNNANTKHIVRFLIDALNLNHINMQQPVINVIASLSGLTPHHVASQSNLPSPVENMDCDLLKLQSEIKRTIDSIDPFFLVKRVNHHIKSTDCAFVQQLFNGYIVSGIKTAQEAEWIRGNGGIMIHLHTSNVFPDFHPINVKLFDVDFNAGDIQTDDKTALNHLLITIRNRSKHLKEAA